MTAFEFLATVETAGIAHTARTFTDSRDRVNLLIDVVEPSTRARVIELGQHAGLDARKVLGAHVYSNRAGVRVVVTGFGGVR